MKIKGWWLSGLASIFSFLGCATTSASNNITKFDWIATESAPKHYPMKIISGTFYYHGSDGDGLYIPSGGTYSKGWGEFISTHIGSDDLKNLPDRVNIIFYSLTEKQFYKGDFNLPYEKILKLFQEGVSADKESPYYRRVMVGTAPGGVVAVWITGRRTTEIFFGQAEKIDLNYGATIGLSFDSKQEEDAFIKRSLVNSLKPDELESLEKNGIPFGLWSRYRNTYRWDLTFSTGVVLAENESPITYLNGEFNFINIPVSQDTLKTAMPLPRELSYVTMIGSKRRNDIVRFEESELMTAFEKLGTNGNVVHIEFSPGVTRETTRVRVYNDKESIELKRAVAVAK